MRILSLIAILSMFLVNAVMAETKKFDSPYKPYTVELPSGWNMFETIGIVVASPEDAGSNKSDSLQIYSQSDVEAPPMQQLVNDFYKPEEGATEPQVNKIQVAGKEAYVRTYDVQIGEQRWTRKEWLFGGDYHHIYIIHYWAKSESFQKYLSDVERAVASLTLKQIPKDKLPPLEKEYQRYKTEREASRGLNQPK